MSEVLIPAIEMRSCVMQSGLGIESGWAHGYYGKAGTKIRARWRISGRSRPHGYGHAGIQLAILKHTRSFERGRYRGRKRVM